MNGHASYRVWDLPVRVTHWLLVVLIALQYASGEFELFDLEWHMLLGQVTLALLVFRLLWGVFGSDNARFRSFVHGPRAVFGYARSVTRREPEYLAGHNPLGGWSITLMLSVLLIHAASGLFASDDLGTVGPLADQVSERVVRWMTRVHKFGKNALLVLIALHLFGVAWHALYKRETLIRPMVTGWRALPRDPGLRFASATRAILLALASGGLVWALVTLF